MIDLVAKAEAALIAIAREGDANPSPANDAAYAAAAAAYAAAVRATVNR